MVNWRMRSISLGVAGVGIASLLLEGALRSANGLDPAAYVLAALTAAPLVVGLRAPLLALAAVEAGAIACAAVFHASWSATGLVLIQLFTVALLGDRQRAVLVAAFTAIGASVAVIVIDSSVELTGAALRVALIVGAAALADMIRSRRALTAAARERAEIERREREEEARQRAAAERLRIAQELHDTLAHSLVAINVRASVALDLDGSEQPDAALRDVKEISATALRDLRATLSLLRSPHEVAPTAPAADLQAVPELIERAHAAGLETELELDVNGAAIPSAIGSAAYRIVQEALTNVLRHADATAATVSVRAVAHALHIEVADNGRSETVGAAPGLGLRGMAERSAALGGQLDVGPLGETGWRVHAVLPLAPSGTE